MENHNMKVTIIDYFKKVFDKKTLGYERFDLILYGFIGLLLLLSVFSLVSILWVTCPLSLLFTPKGWSNFLTIFDFPIKVLAATLLFTTIKVTVKRIIQTEKNLRLMKISVDNTEQSVKNSIENNQLNNYSYS